jgi:hypothetical protein
MDESDDHTRKDLLQQAGILEVAPHSGHLPQALKMGYAFTASKYTAGREKNWPWSCDH